MSILKNSAGSESRRLDFRALDQDIHGHPLIYLDNAATTQKPRQVIEAVKHFYECDNSNVHRGVHELSNRATIAYEGARVRTAKFINAASDREIIFTRGTTESINLAANAWGNTHLKKGDVILLTEMEHHSNIVPWQLLAQRTGAVLAYVPVIRDEGLLDLAQLHTLLPQAKLFAFTHVSNTLGTINPVKELCGRARELGVTTLIDAAQSAGHRPLDVQDIGCDFLAFSSHKMCGPTGVGVLYGRRELLDGMQPYQGGGDMISSVDLFQSTWKEPPHKFEAGTPNISGVIGLHAAMDYLDALGRENICRYDEELSAYAYDSLAKVKDLQLFGPKENRAGLVSFLLGGIHSHDVVTMANEHGIALRGGNHCNQPLMKLLGVEATIRASFYFYNTRPEVDRLVEVLREIRQLFAG
ncbi:MAG: cysteine desulfurase [Verrucomicrobiales bacterium]|nr:cysteine desulfurase [Verrucomicrobiales bacterium]